MSARQSPNTSSAEKKKKVKKSLTPKIKKVEEITEQDLNSDVIPAHVLSVFKNLAKKKTILSYDDNETPPQSSSGLVGSVFAETDDGDAENIDSSAFAEAENDTESEESEKDLDEDSENDVVDEDPEGEKENGEEVESGGETESDKEEDSTTVKNNNTVVVDLTNCPTSEQERIIRSLRAFTHVDPNYIEELVLEYMHTVRSDDYWWGRIDQLRDWNRMQMNEVVDQLVMADQERNDSIQNLSTTVFNLAREQEESRDVFLEAVSRMNEIYNGLTIMQASMCAAPVPNSAPKKAFSGVKKIDPKTKASTRPNTGGKCSSDVTDAINTILANNLNKMDFKERRAYVSQLVPSLHIQVADAVLRLFGFSGEVLERLKARWETSSLNLKEELIDKINLGEFQATVLRISSEVRQEIAKEQKKR